MSKIITLKKGLNINLKGKAEETISQAPRSTLYAVKPTDFFNLTPKLTVKVGDEVKAGSALFYNKYNPDVKFTSPVSGKVVEVRRGERRTILEVVVEAGQSDDYVEFKKGDPSGLSKEDLIATLLESGMWPTIRQRPYDIAANPLDKPKAIFISGFDSAPLAADVSFLLQNNKEEFQKGVDVLQKLTEGKVHLSLDANAKKQVLENISGVEYHHFKGVHPAGNVGIQVHHIDPVNKGEIVWMINPQDVALMGRLFMEGRYRPEINMALVGSEVEKTQYFTLLKGASVKGLIENNLKQDNVRIISGNVLTGEKVLKEGFIGYYDSTVSVIPEGDYEEPFGWATLGIGKLSPSRSYFSWLTPKKEYSLDTNFHGGVRAFVLSDQYDKVFPMDIMPVQLLKAIIVEDIDLMEQLGIYEVSPEDFALCEYICVSKIEAQDVVQKGLELMIKEFS